MQTRRRRGIANSNPTTQNQDQLASNNTEEEEEKSNVSEIVRCPNCDEILSMEEIETHSENCSNPLEICEICNSEFPRIIFHAHIRHCRPGFPIHSPIFPPPLERRVEPSRPSQSQDNSLSSNNPGRLSRDSNLDSNDSSSNSNSNSQESEEEEQISNSPFQFPFIEGYRLENVILSARRSNRSLISRNNPLNQSIHPNYPNRSPSNPRRPNQRQLHIISQAPRMTAPPSGGISRCKIMIIQPIVKGK